MSKIHWSHPSIKKLGRTTDPVATIIQRAREVVLEALESGWTGPPFDPFALAEVLKIPVVPSQDIIDARTVPTAKGNYRIEFNPERPSARIRFSVAHEIAHTLFPDCAEQVRNRMARPEIKKDDWQLEMLCNLGASEILMPTGSFPALGSEDLAIDHLMQLRSTFGVSAEATLLRVVRLTNLPAVMFAASVEDEQIEPRQYRIDYSVGSLAWDEVALERDTLPVNSCVSHCTAIGYTAHGMESWRGLSNQLKVECVGIPAHRGRRLPRVVGLVAPINGNARRVPQIQYVKGSALEPRGEGYRIVAQVVNDVSPIWGGGFALVVRKKWPDIQNSYKTWAHQFRSRPELGKCHFTDAAPDVGVFSIVAQAGLGASKRRRIRYNALSEGLSSLATIAADKRATVHMPRIGCGQAGGDWSIVSELIHDTLTRAGIEVIVYDLPDKPWEPRRLLFD